MTLNTHTSSTKHNAKGMTHRYKNGASYEVRDAITRSFDAADRVKTETDAEGNASSYSYDDAGNVIAVTDAEGHSTRFEYDPMNRRTAVIDATGYRTETMLTLRGDVVGITNANDETIKFEVDALGRKTAAIDAMGFRSEFQYDENGNLTCTVDASAQAGLQPRNSLGCSESRQYDELNRVTRIVDALNDETSFTYDLAGKRLTVKDAEAKTWTFTYDDLGRLTSETDHSARTVSYKPDEAGNVYEKTNRLNEVTRYTFDAGNRLTRVDYLKDGSAETFGFDAAGNRNAAANAVVSYSFTWDRLNRLTGKLDDRGKSMSFSFDKVGNRKTSAMEYVFRGAVTPLQKPHLHASALDFAGVELLHRRQRNVALHRHKGGEFGHVDLADLFTAVARVGGQGAQHVAGTDFFLAPAQNLQGHHRRQQRPLAGGGEFIEFVPDRRAVLVLLDLADKPHLVHARQAQGQARFAGAAGAANAMHMHLGVRGNVDIDHRFELRDVQPARGHVGGHQHRAAAVGKLCQHLVALTLLQLAVQGLRAEALILQIGDQFLALLFGVAKRQRADWPKVVEQQRHRFKPVGARHLIEALFDQTFGVL